MFKILVVEDDNNIRKIIAKNLINNGYSVIECSDGKIALNTFENEYIDLVISDIMMPNMDGNELVQKIRAINKDIPILMLTALESYEDKEKAFLNGSDDYMVKPINMNEMLLRVKALLRRYKIANENKIELKNLTIYNNNTTIIVNGEKVELTKKELLLLFKLLSTPNIIFTRTQLMNEIWGYDNDSDDRTVDTHIKRIREKINSNDFEIITVRGLGYKGIIK